MKQLPHSSGPYYGAPCTKPKRHCAACASCEICGWMLADHLAMEAAPSKLPAFNTPGGPADEVDQLKKRVAFLERELAGAEDRYLKLDQIYNKLADQWSVFQATTRPDNRNIQRAEGAGEMARKLGEVLLSAAYGTDARALLRDLLADMEGGSGRTVEVGGKLVKR